MQITYQLTEKDFVEAYGTNRKRKPFGKWSSRVVGCVTLLVLIAIILGLVLQNGARVTKDYLPLACLALAWFIILEAWPRWEMKQQFRKQPGAHGPRTVLFDDEGAHWRWDGGSSDILWKNYIRWTEGDKQILLYSSPACFSMLPKRALDPAQLTELREILKQKIQQAR
jgi:hypothetical protein